MNLLNLGPDEKIAAVVPVREFSAEQYLIFGTRLGVVKKTALSAYGNVRTVGLNAINIAEGDELIEVRVTSDGDEILIASRKGMSIRFNETDARPMGRATAGVRGLNLRDDDEVVGMVVGARGLDRARGVRKGTRKRTPISEYRLQKRGGYGVINLKVSEKTGEVVTVRAVSEDEQVMIITRKGVVNRQRVEEIRVIGRATQGVKLMNLDDGDVVMDVARVIIDDDDEDGLEGAEAPAGEISVAAPNADARMLSPDDGDGDDGGADDAGS